MTWPLSALDFPGVYNNGTECGDALRAAFAAAANAKIWLPAGTYVAAPAPGAQAIFDLTYNQPIIIEGDGAGYGGGTRVQPHPSTPSGVDIFRIRPPSISVTFTSIRDLSIVSSGLGRHAINIDASASPNSRIYRLSLCDLSISPTASGHSIYSADAAHSGGGFFLSHIERCSVDSIHLADVGDSIRIIGCELGSATRRGIYISQQMGSGNLVIEGCNITAHKGQLKIGASAGAVIRDCVFEQPENTINTEGAMIDLGEGSGIAGTVLNPRILGCQIQVSYGATGFPIRIASATNTYIDGNRIAVWSGPHILLAPSWGASIGSVGTIVGPGNEFCFGSTVGGYEVAQMINQGTGTWYTPVAAVP